MDETPEQLFARLRKDGESVMEIAARLEREAEQDFEHARNLEAYFETKDFAKDTLSKLENSQKEREQ